MQIDLTNPLQKITEPAPDNRPAAPGKPATTPPPPPPTPEELKKQTEDAFDAMGWGKPPEAAIPEPPAAPAAGTPPASQPTEPPAEPQPEPEPEPELSQGDVIQQTARAVAKEVATALRPQAPTTPPLAAPAAAPSGTLEMVPEDAESHRIIQWLEQSNPAKYAGMAAKFVEYLKKVYAYQDAWLEKNPGKNYDANDEEHADFYAANEFPVTAAELDQARIDMIAEQRASEKVAPLQQELTAMKDEQRIKAAEPEMNRNFARVVVRLVDLTSETLSKALKDEKGNPNFSQERLAAAEEADPIAKSILDELVDTQLKPLIHELEKTAVPGVNYRLNPSNPVHAQILQYQRRAERDMAAAPPDVQVQEGKQWVSVARMAQMQREIANGRGSSEEKEAAMADLNSRYWVLTVDHLEELIAHDLAQGAKKIIERAESLAAKKYGGAKKSPAAPAAPAAAAAPATPAAAPRPAGSKPRSPSTSSASDVVTTPGTAGAGQKSFAEQATDVLFSR